ncbi:MAG: PrsW family glutamic-type intramembrane protease [Bacteroidota bacterium]
MDFTLIGLAIAPGVSIALYVYLRDKYEREPMKLLLQSFAAGFFVIIPAALIEMWLGNTFALEDSVASVAIRNFLFIGLTEEACKFLCLLAIAYPKPDFNEPFDGITYAVMVSMGFATSENMMYVFDGGLHVAMVRIFTAVPAHASFSVLMGYFVGLAKFERKHERLYLFLGLFSATIFHGAYDFFLSIDSIELIALGSLAALIVGIRLSFKAMRILNEHSPFKYAKLFRQM